MAAARGLQDSDVDPANEDANIVSKRLLGSGAVGTVYELTRSDGRQVVFKGETESRTGLAALSAGSAKNYDTGQMAVNLNFASKKAAVALGMGGLIVDYSAGSHKGVFGFYMEKAKGVTPGLLQREIPSSSSETGMSAIDIRCLPVNEQLKILADIKRELNRLHWLDLVTGQAERLKEEGNIVEGEAWQHVREKPLQTGNVTVQNRNGRNKQLGGDIAKTVNELSCPSYFARDKLQVTCVYLFKPHGKENASLAVECGIIGGARKNKEVYKKMEFSTLVSRLGDKFGLEMDGSLGAAGLEIDGVAVILQLAGGPRGDILFTHADLGLPPSERYDAVVGAVLEANFLYQGTGGASFAINPADGHLHLQRYDWLERLDVDDTLAMLQRFSETISSWKSIMADVQQAAVNQASASDSGEQAVSGGFMQV